MNTPDLTNLPFPEKELRIKKGLKIMEYIRHFSATERVIFGIFILAAGITTLIMATSINNRFLIEIPGYGGTLREGVVGLPYTINPVLAVTDVDRDLTTLIYSGLMKYDGDELAPDLAKSYEISADGLIYTFYLKPNLKFQDGQALTADDVAFTIQKIQDQAIKNPRAADWKDIKVIVSAPDQIQFILKKAYSPFITNTTIGIIPKHIWSNVTNEQFVFNNNNISPTGSGPYKVESIVRDDKQIPLEYHLTTWRQYHGKRPYIDNMVFRFFSDKEKALDALTSGLIDSLSSISPKEASAIQDDQAGPYRIISTTLPRIFGIFFNAGQNPILADVAVRQALNMSVDREKIVKSVLNGYGAPLFGALPVAFGQATSSKTVSDKANPAGASALLEKNGWKKNPAGIYEKTSSKKEVKKLSLEIYTADIPDLKQTLEMIKESWTKLGVEVSVKVFEPTDLYQTVVRTRQYDALLFGELIGKDNDLYAFWHSSQRISPGLNIAMYTNSKVDKILEDIRTESDFDTREKKYAQLESQIGEDVPAVFLYSPDFLYAVPKKILGIRPDNIAIASDRFNGIANWYMKTEKVWPIFSKNFFNK